MFPTASGRLHNPASERDAPLAASFFASVISRAPQFSVGPHNLMADISIALSSRVHCPCCGYPTLEAGGEYEICELCNWEDDGQSDADADEVRGGPNAEYSLTEARRNFARYRVMYEPGRDMRITGADSKLEWETKGLLIQAFEGAASASANRNALVNEIVRLEKILRDETARQVREYEAKQGDST